jgi:hypothetical protein
VYDLFNRVGDGPVHESLHRNGYVNGDTGWDGSRDLYDLFYALLYWIGNLSVSHVLNRIRNRPLDDLLHRNRDLDWHGNVHRTWNVYVLLYESLHRIGHRSVDELFHSNWNLPVVQSLIRDSDGSLHKLLHGIWNVDPVRHRHIVWCRIRSVNNPVDRVRHWPRNGFLNRHGYRMIYVSIDIVGDGHSHILFDRNGYVPSVINEAVVWNLHLRENIPFDRNGLKSLS